MNISVNQILEMPNAALLAERLQNALQAEQENRRHFYEIIEEDKKMEFINGEIIFQSPAKLRHTNSIKLLTNLLSNFVIKNDLGFVGSEKMLISLTRNDYEPDICFFEKAKSNSFKSDQMQFPAPDLAVEVLSPSTEKFDREIKFQDYAAHGIREYWIIDPENEFIEQYFLQTEEYELLLKAKDGTIESIVLPEFKIQIRAVFDEKLNLEELKRLI
ncbi:MAG: Uma2 family endonuclease [Pyrinomonadaceae bacterium]|nr:Uma2 family endonuclease [Pyrinomonadaceae bacterium]